ncbi:sugar transferase [Marinobacterium jannaschii]|uniref:sugar transferase n=1 Tax=Marinobacterium jannaschii TaxID=64970 RepID=UPI00048454D6|nr:sugar transferase [Marinobacterium jannaschii]
MKRLFDISAALVSLVIFAPVLVIVAVLIRLDTPGPVVFRQKRVGLNGKAFEILKFRSMVTDAATRGPHFTSANDPRITRVGALLRRTSLDELPQLINVLTGDMSVVGPRPNVPAQRAEYTSAEWGQRNKVRPGITGLAQATKRSTATPEERTRLDLEYVEKSSFLFDIKIILMTIKQIATRGGN